MKFTSIAFTGLLATTSAFLTPTLIKLTPLKSCGGRISSLRMQATKDIVDTAVGAGSFNTLAAALTAAGLVDTLKGPGPFTVFAPTDEAFAKIPKSTLDAILADKKKLTSILTYHVVPGKVMASDVIKIKEAPTVQGSKAKVTVTTAGVKIDMANVIKTDIEATNGVIHVIDSVILPPAPAASSKPSKPSLASIEPSKAGSSAPFGFFDPLGLSKGLSVKDLKKYRESEIKHGRIAMLATVGVVVQEAFSPFYQPAEETGLSMDPGPAVFHFQQMEHVAPFVLFPLAMGIATIEAAGIAKGWDGPEEYVGPVAGMKESYLAGDLAFDPLNLAPVGNEAVFLSQRTKELNNGRLAMIAWWGMMVQELITGHRLFE